MFASFSKTKLVFRRALALLLGLIAFPFLIFFSVERRARVYSFLHRYWLKNGEKPVWLAESERWAR